MAAEEEVPQGFHHVELWVPELARAIAEWGWLLGELGWVPDESWDAGASWLLGSAYLVVEQSPGLTNLVHDRCAAGLNHLALHGGAPATVDRLHAAAGHGWTPLFAERYPHAGGPASYAAYLVNSDGFEVELVAERGEAR